MSVPTPLSRLEIVSTATRQLRVESFQHLQSLPAEPDWLWRGFLAAGSVTMLSGHPFAGKSTLVCGLLQAMEAGKPFLDRPTRAGTALLVNEEDDAPLRERARLFRLFGLTSEYVPRSESVRHEWDELVELATARALAAGHHLLVIDTFPGLAGLRDEEENDAGAIGWRMRPLQQAAARGLCVLFLHHMNGQSQPRGSKAFRGIVDISTRLIAEGRSSKFRLLTHSRFPNVASASVRAELVRAPSGWSYRPLKQRQGRSDVSVDDALRAALVEAGPRGLTYDDLDEIEGLKRHREETTAEVVPSHRRKTRRRHEERPVPLVSGGRTRRRFGAVRYCLRR